MEGLQFLDGTLRAASEGHSGGDQVVLRRDMRVDVIPCSDLQDYCCLKGVSGTNCTDRKDPLQLNDPGAGLAKDNAGKNDRPNGNAADNPYPGTLPTVSNRNQGRETNQSLHTG